MSSSADLLPGTPAAIADRRRARDLLAGTLERFALPVLLVVVIVVFSAARSSTFATWGNVQSILSTQSVLAVLALAAVIPFACGQFDLSLPSILGLSQIVAASLMSHDHWALGPALLAALGVGALAGLANGFIVAELGVSSIITTLGTASLAQGIAAWSAHDATIDSGISPSLINFGSRNWIGIPRPAFAILVVAVIVGYILRQTPVGRSMEALGANARAAKLVGLPGVRLTILGFVLAGAIAGGAGVLQVATAGSADPTFGPGLLLPMLTAVFLGATTIRPGQYSVSGALLAFAFLAASISGLTLIGAQDYVTPIYQGCALVGAVALSTVVRRRRFGRS